MADYTNKSKEELNSLLEEFIELNNDLQEMAGDPDIDAEIETNKKEISLINELLLDDDTTQKEVDEKIEEVEEQIEEGEEIKAEIEEQQEDDDLDDRMEDEDFDREVEAVEEERDEIAEQTQEVVEDKVEDDVFVDFDENYHKNILEDLRKNTEFGLGGNLVAGGVGAYLGAKYPKSVKKVTDPLDKAFNDIKENLTGEKKFENGGKIDYSGYEVYDNGEVQADVYDMDEESYYVQVDNKYDLKFNNKLELDRYLESERFEYKGYEKVYAKGGKVDNVKRYLDEFPSDATSWADATDEIRDLSRASKEYVNEYDLDVLDDDPKAVKPLDFRELKKPSQWNTEGKKYILKNIDKMSDRTFELFYNDYRDWFDKSYAKGGKVDIYDFLDKKKRFTKEEIEKTGFEETSPNPDDRMYKRSLRADVGYWDPKGDGAVYEFQEMKSGKDKGKLKFHGYYVKRGYAKGGMTEKDKLDEAIRHFEDKIKKQGRITNARDEEHLSKLKELRKSFAKGGDVSSAWDKMYAQHQGDTQSDFDFREKMERYLENADNDKSEAWEKMYSDHEYSDDDWNEEDYEVIEEMDRYAKGGFFSRLFGGKPKKSEKSKKSRYYNLHYIISDKKGKPIIEGEVSYPAKSTKEAQDRFKKSLQERIDSGDYKDGDKIEIFTPKQYKESKYFKKGYSKGGELDDVEVYVDEDFNSYTVVLDNSVFEMNEFTGMGDVNMYIGERNEFPSDLGKRLSHSSLSPELIKKIKQRKTMSFESGGKIQTRYEVELIENVENNPKRAFFIVNQRTFDDIERLQYAGGFKRFDIDLYEDDSKKNMSNINELDAYIRSLGIAPEMEFEDGGVIEEAIKALEDSLEMLPGDVDIMKEIENLKKRL